MELNQDHFLLHAYEPHDSKNDASEKTFSYRHHTQTVLFSRVLILRDFLRAPFSQNACHISKRKNLKHCLKVRLKWIAGLNLQKYKLIWNTFSYPTRQWFLAIFIMLMFWLYMLSHVMLLWETMSTDFAFIRPNSKKEILIFRELFL